MKYLLSLFLIAIVGCNTTSKNLSTSSDAFAEQFTVNKVAPDTYVITDSFFYDSNVLVAKMKDGTVFIASSPFEGTGTTEMIQWIQQTLKPTRMINVNTHFHSDGSGGNEAYKNLGVEVWSSHLTKKLYDQNFEQHKKINADDFNKEPELHKRILAKKKTFADNIFDEKKGKTFEFSGEKVQLIYPGPAHTEDNVVVYFPDRKVLFGTCMIRPENSLGYLKDANVKSWANSVKKVQGLGAETVIPGHGAVGGPELIEQTIRLATDAVKSKKK